MTRRLELARIAALAAVLAAAPSGVGQAPAPQDQQAPFGTERPTFRAEVEYVEVDALVTDPEGRFVRDLTADDFEVFEDGRRQQIAAFSVVDIPVEPPDRALYSPDPIEPDVQSNERPFDGRVYVLVLDDLHTDFSRSPRVRTAARQFVERHLGANDLMAVVQTGGRSDGTQEFTSNKRMLVAAIDHFAGRKLESATLTRNAEYFRQLGMPLNDTRIPDPLELERGHNARSSLEVVRKIAEWFGGVRGRRKALIFISEGIDYDVSDIIRGPMTPASSASAVLDDIRQAIAATARSNVSIYAVDPRGLTTLAEDTIGVTSFADTSIEQAPAGDRSPRDDPRGIGISAIGNALFLAQQNLRALSEETNGFATINANEYATAFDRIVRDNSAYYVLAYYPPSTKRDGRFHRIEVRVKRPRLRVRARRGYVAPRGDRTETAPPQGTVSAAVTEALNSPLQVSGLTMHAFAAPFKGEGSTASVLLGLDLRGRDISITPKNRLEISYTAVDKDGKVVNPQNHVLTLNLRPETRARAEETGFRVLNRLDLKPGRYQLRAASRDTGGGAVGSIIYDLEVPDFEKERISMSGLVLTSMSGSTMVTVRPDEALQDVLPAAPIAQRVFPSNDEIALYVEVYDTSGPAPHKVDIVATVRSDAGTVQFQTEDERDSSELAGERGGYGYAARIPLTDLVPGAYVLTVEARSRLRGDFVAARHVRFRVTGADIRSIPR